MNPNEFWLCSNPELENYNQPIDTLSCIQILRPFSDGTSPVPRIISANEQAILRRQIKRLS